MHGLHRGGAGLNGRERPHGKLGSRWPGGKRLAFCVAVSVEHFHFGEGLGHTPCYATHRPDVRNSAGRCASHLHGSILSTHGDDGTVKGTDNPDWLKEISSIIGKSGFVPRLQVIEVHGVRGSWGAGRVSA